MDGIPIHVLKALASLQNQISHVHAKRTDACDLFIGFAYFEFARFLGQFRINSKRYILPSNVAPAFTLEHRAGVRLQRYEETSTIQNKKRSFCYSSQIKYTNLGYNTS